MGFSRLGVPVLVWLIASSNAFCQNWFGAPRLITNEPIRVVIDVDLDGDLDLIRVVPAPSGSSAVSFTVMVNSGSGDFTDAAPVVLPVGLGVVVVAGDVTGDGDADLLISTSQTYSTGLGVLVYPGSTGPAFGLPIHTSVSAPVQSMHVANVNGDSMLDIGVSLAVPTGLQFNWYLAVGSGSFSTMPGVSIPSAQLDPRLISLTLDGNGDGVIDVALVGSAGLILCPTLGGATVVGATIPIATAAAGEAFAVGDADGDGDTDVIYAGAMSGGSGATGIVRVLNLGGGNWSAPALQSFPAMPTNTGARIVVGDWDADAVPDVVMTTPIPGPTQPLAGRVRWFASSASGVLSFAAGIETWEPDPGALGIFDMSGDSLPDLVGGSEVIYGTGAFSNPFIQVVGGGTVTVRPRDWDDDGDLDFEASTIGVYVANDGRGVLFNGIALTLPPTSPGTFYGGPFVVGDFNGDARPDWLVGRFMQALPFPTFLDHRILADAGNGTLVDLGQAWPVQILLSSGTPTLVADVNGDGNDDLIGSSSIWFSSGAGQLVPSGVTYPSAVPIAAGDMDGDGDLDFLAAVPAGGQTTVSIFLNVMLGTAFQSIPLDTGLGPGVRGRLSDLDNDGDVDALIGYLTTTSSMPIRVIENINNGAIVTHQLALSSLSPQLVVASVDAGDVDADGLTDVVIGYAPPYVGSPSIAPFTVLRRVGPGLLFDPPRTFSTLSFSRLADLDDDGDPDVAGSCLLFNRHYLGPSGGSGRQYGTGSLGSGGMRPILGRSGPVRTGSSTSLRVRRGLGGGQGNLVIGAAQSNVTYPLYPGIVSYAEPWLTTLPITLQGSPGSPGSGVLDLGFSVPPSLSLVTLYFQAGVFDPGAPVGVAVTNGLEIAFGL